MNTPARLAAFTAGLAAVFAATVGIGSAVGPLGEPADAGHEGMTAPASATAEPAAGAPLPGGLQVSDQGVTLALDSGVLPAGPATPVAFRVLGADGAPLTAYTEEHGEDLHLVAVRRDLSGYQHVHPEMAADGTWTTSLDLTPGSWRLLADTTPAGGPALVLGADLSVPGEYTPAPLPEPSLTAEVDGYTVVLTGELVPGRETELTLSVSRDGVPVRDLQPYLGAYGHLVALRAGDLAYLHVHPTDGEPGDPGVAPGPHVRFAATAPSAGTYRLFLDFRHGDVVHTAAFTVTAGPAPAGGTPAPDTPAHDGSADHGHGN
ncbi:hypothetical protein [Blastococcus sp. SYSU D00820]